MTQILIVGRIEVDPQRRDELLEAIRPYLEATRRDEPGCLEYAFSADTVQDDLVVVVETWADEPSLAAHFEHPNFFATKDAMRAHGSRGSQILKYRSDLSEPVRDSEDRYRADFFTDRKAPH